MVPARRSGMAVRRNSFASDATFVFEAAVRMRQSAVFWLCVVSIGGSVDAWPPFPEDEPPSPSGKTARLLPFPDGATSAEEPCVAPQRGLS